MRLWALPAVCFCLMLVAHTTRGQSWSVQVEAPAEFLFRVSVGDNDSSRKTYTLEDIDGLLISVGTPYHVGVGLESYSGHFRPVPQFDIKLSVTVASVFVDIPVPWLKFHVGAGWGELSFDPDEVQGGDNSSDPPTKLEKSNLWEWFARVGIPLPWSFDLLIGYREFHTRLVSRNYDRTPIDAHTQDVTGTLTTVGLQYTF